MFKRVAALLLTALCSALCQQPGANGQPQTADVLRVNDQLMISASEVPGMSDKPYRVEPDGTVTLPLVGKIRAEGLTADQFRNELIDQFKIYVRNPAVTVQPVQTVLAQNGDTIVVSGAFRNPGIHPLPSRRTLLYVVSEVGGLQPNAGAIIKVLRRPERGRIPLPSALEDPVSKISTVTINFNRLMENPAAPENILIEANDILTAEPAGSVFLTGEVLRPGAVALTDRESIGVTELVSQAGGFNRDAAPEKAKILRQILNGSKRAEIPVDIRSILDGHAFDFAVQANDIVVIPRRKGGGAAVRTALMWVAPVAMSAALYSLLRN